MRKYTIMAALCASAALPALAQFGPAPGGPDGGHFGPGFMRPGSHEVVAGAPYSATFSNTVVEHLSDGNVIQRSNSGQVARDGQGRTYEQQVIRGGPLAPEGGKTLTFITDPVAGYSYVLDADKKVAFRRPFRARTEGDGTPRFQSGPRRSNAEVTETALPPDSSTGVYAEGRSTARTIAAGTIGNAQPIVSTVQRWYSPDLKIVVKSVRKDPRFGDSTYALSNVSRNEPDVSLFQVPAGYTVQDGRGGPEGGRGWRGPGQH